MKKDIYNPDFVKSLFNNMSTSYERMNYITSFGFSIKWRKESLRFIKIEDIKPNILDLFTGMGENWSFIHNKFENYNLTALDFSEKMIEKAKAQNKSVHKNKINIVLDDIYNQSLPNNHYDFIICSFGLKTLNSYQINKLAIEIRRILKPNGQISFIEISVPNNRILKLLYKFYLKRIIPILGKVLLGNPNEYRMLWKYTSRFKNAKEAKEIFTEHGFSTEYKEYFFGCATGIIGNKIKNFDYK